MDKEAENMDKISSSPAFSINSETTENTVKSLQSTEKKKKWKRCFSGWQRKKIQAAPLKGLDQEEISNSLTHQSINEDEETFSQTSVDSSRPVAETKAKKSKLFLCFFPYIFSKNEKKMKDKEAENMDKISSSPAFPINSETSENTNISVSGTKNQTTEDPDDLMHCDDILDDEEYTCPCTHPIISEERISTCSSSWSSEGMDNISTNSSSWCSMSENGRMTDSTWCSSPDSDISHMITSFDQNIDEEITKVCQSFWNPENMETEADDFGEDPTTETGSTLRLSIRSEEIVRSASCVSSSTTNTAITEAGEMLVSYVIDEAVKILQSTEAVKTLQFTEAVKTPQSTEAVKTLPSSEAAKTLRSTKKKKWKRCFSGWQRKKIQAATLKDLDQEAMSSSLTHKSNNCGDEDEETFSQTSVDCSRPVAENKAKKSNHVSCFYHIYFSKMSDSSNMEEAQNMDKISSSPGFPINSETAENTNISVSGTNNQTAEDPDDLMHCYDILDDEEYTCPCTHPIISEERISTCSSSWSSEGMDSISTNSSSWCSMSENGRMTDSTWCSSPDSDISDMITSFDQNINEEITKVCQSFWNPENMETEADDFGEDPTTETGSIMRLSIRSEEIVRSATCVSSSSTNTAITEAGKMLVSYVIDEAVKILQSTEAVKTLPSSEAVKTLQSTEAVKTLQSTEKKKRCFSGWQRKMIQAAPLKDLVQEQSINSDEDEETFSQTSVDSSRPVVETKAKKSKLFLCFFPYIFSKNEKKIKEEEKQMKQPRSRSSSCAECRCCLDM